MRGFLARFIFTGGALLAPLFASAHGTEFLLGKLTLAPDALRLELTADCEGNPMIADRAEAEKILPAALRMRIGDSTNTLGSLASLKLEERTKFDETAPLPPGTFDNSISHRLLTAVWQWTPERASLPVRFTVPKGSVHDVLLWVVDPSTPKEPPRWMVLLGGDATPEIVVPSRGRWIGRWWLAGGGACGLVLIGWFWRRRQQPVEQF